MAVPIQSDHRRSWPPRLRTAAALRWALLAAPSVGLLVAACGQKFTGGGGGGGGTGATTASTTGTAAGGAGAGGTTTTPAGTTTGTSVGGASGCVHSECAVGVALDETCSGCAHEVCQQSEECCALEWTAECMEQAYALCACEIPCDELFGNLGLYFACPSDPGRCVFFTSSASACDALCGTGDLTCLDAAVAEDGARCDPVAAKPCSQGSPGINERELCVCGLP